MNQRGLDDLATGLDATATRTRQLDVTDRDAVLDAFETFADWTGGRLDLLFNNAGIDAKGPFESMSWEQIMSVVNVNLVGGLSVIHAGIPLLRSTANSLCLSTTSASAIFGTAQLAVYSATKHAIKGLTEALSVELARHNVRAMDILPAIVDTGMLPPELKAILPTEGTFRPLPADEVAEVVWQAYHGDKLHWYVPAELADHAARATTRARDHSRRTDRRQAVLIPGQLSSASIDSTWAGPKPSRANLTPSRPASSIGARNGSDSSEPVATKPARTSRKPASFPRIRATCVAPAPSSAGATGRKTSNDSSSGPVSATVFSRCSSSVMTSWYPPQRLASRPAGGLRAGDRGEGCSVAETSLAEVIAGLLRAAEGTHSG